MHFDRSQFRFACFSLLWMLSTLAGAKLSIADEPQPTAADIQAALVDLDDAEFLVREAAQEKLRAWADVPALRPRLAGVLEPVLDGTNVSSEVRAQLEPLVRSLPPATGRQSPSVEAIGPLLDQLAGDTLSARASAQRLLAEVLGNTHCIGPLLVQAKARLADPHLLPETRRLLTLLVEDARRAWIFADAAKVTFPPVETAQMNAWLDDLLRSDNQPRAAARRAAARHEILDLVVRDDTRAIVVPLLRDRVNQGSDAASNELRPLIDMTQPGLVAEAWGRANSEPNLQHLTVQYLLLGLRQFPEGSRNATLFDQCDDRTAHCVTGNTLSEGNYPVGVAFPNPVRVAFPNPVVPIATFFHLTNLPTPRARLAYQFDLGRNPSERLLDISRRTLDDFVRERRVLSEDQVLMLAELNPGAVSRFVGPYFAAVPDKVLRTSTVEMQYQITVHSGICQMLSLCGTNEAVPALEQAARSGRLMQPSSESPYHIAWMAALAIAARDPWPAMDSWLAALASDKTPLVAHAALAPELGASAAAILVARHDKSPEDFGLQKIDEMVSERLNFAGYRFASEDDRQALLAWWKSVHSPVAAR